MTSQLGRQQGKVHCLTRGLCPRTPGIYGFRAKIFCFKLKPLERRIGLRRDATRAPIQGPKMANGRSPTAAPKLKPKTPSSISLLRVKNGLDKGVHFRLR